MNYGEYFGKTDAQFESQRAFNSYFLTQNWYKYLKIGRRKSGISVVVGSRGSGKTAVRRRIEDKNKLVYSLNGETDVRPGFKVSSYDHQSSYYSHALTLQFLTQFMNSVSSAKNSFSKEARRNLPGTLRDMHQYIVSIIGDDTTLEFKGDEGSLKLNMGKLLLKSFASLSQLSINRFKEILAPCLVEIKGYILIDDVDDVFPDSDSNYEFIEGLIVASKRINHVFGNMLHCLVFLHTGAYDKFYEYGRNFGRVVDEGMVKHMCWTPEDYQQLLLKRVSFAEGLRNADPATVWAQAFDLSNASVDDYLNFFASRSNTGPRDLIDLGNKAKQEAREYKITLADLEAAEKPYSKLKLRSLRRDFSRQYGDVTELVKITFKGQHSKYNADDFFTRIDAHMLGSDQIKNSALYESLLIQLFDPHNIAEKLFEFGFIGYREKGKEEIIYSKGCGSDSLGLTSASEIYIHPAFHSELMLQQ